MERIKDFVCGAELDKEKSADRYDYEGKTYHFCSQKCRDDFSKDPRQYIK